MLMIMVKVMREDNYSDDGDTVMMRMIVIMILVMFDDKLIMVTLIK